MRRIVIRQQARSPEDAVLRAVAEAAQHLDSEITGLFIEDIDLFNLAGMPFASEVCRSSATRRVMDVASMERSLRRLADHARQALETIAQQRSLRATFRVTRGALLAELLAAAAEGDVVVAGALTRAPHPSAFTLICQATVAPNAVAHLLNALAPQLRSGFALMLLGATPTEANEWEGALRQSLDLPRLGTRVVQLQSMDETEINRLRATRQDPDDALSSGSGLSSG